MALDGRYRSIMIISLVVIKFSTAGGDSMDYFVLISSLPIMMALVGLLERMKAGGEQLLCREQSICIGRKAKSLFFNKNFPILVKKSGRTNRSNIFGRVSNLLSLFGSPRPFFFENFDELILI